MPMNTLRTALLALVVAAAFRAAAQPVYTFRVKVGIDRESVDSLGGRDRVVQLTEDMFRRVNRAFNYGAQLRAVYDFVVDWTPSTSTTACRPTRSASPIPTTIIWW